jgi:hypothetical protein
MLNQREEITVKSDVVAKASPELEEIKPKAVAGLTEKELIENNVVGALKEEDQEDSDESEESKEEETEV